MSFLFFRKRCCLLPPGWSLTRRRSSSSLAAISRELKTVSIKPSFSSWRSCLAQNSAHRVLVCSSHSCFTVLKTTRCLTQPNLISTGISPDLAESVGVWLPSDPFLWLPVCRGTRGAVACHPLLVGQPAHSTGSDQVHGWPKIPGTSRLGSTDTLAHFFSVTLLLSCNKAYLYIIILFPDSFFVCGLNLTADRRYIAENRNQSLRTLTFSNWECLRQWLEVQRPGSDPDCLNIIAGDFVGPLPLCSLVIALNQKLLWKKGRR